MPPSPSRLLRPLRSRAALALSLLLLAGGCAARAEASAPGAYPREDSMPPSAAAPAPERPMASPDMAMASPDMAMASPAMPPMPSDAPAAPAPARAKSTGAQPSAGDKRAQDTASSRSSSALIIYQGALQMLAEGDQFPATLDRIIDVAESVGGHLAGRTDNQVEIRVPSARFRDALTLIDKLGGVTRRSVTAQDVSEEFHDSEVRLLNLRATRKRLEEFLAKASGIQDLLTLERELERVAKEIDRLEGRMRFLRERAAFSQITVALQPKPKPPPVVVAAPTPPPPPPPGPRQVALPIEWFSNLGLGRVLRIN